MDAAFKALKTAQEDAQNATEEKGKNNSIKILYTLKNIPKILI